MSHETKKVFGFWYSLKTKPKSLSFFEKSVSFKLAHFDNLNVFWYSNWDFLSITILKKSLLTIYDQSEL